MCVVLRQAWTVSQWSVLLGYVAQMLAAIKHVAGDSFVSHQDSTSSHYVLSKVQLLQCKIHNFQFPELQSQQPRAEPH